jgi:4-hydroxy 2-oxovalerate aldolase
LKDLRSIIEKLDEEQKKMYDYSILEKLYVEHFNNEINDSAAQARLKEMFRGRKLLLLAPGSSLNSQKNKIEYFIREEKPLVAGVNNDIKNYPLDFIFFSGINRYRSFSRKDVNLIVTSNIKDYAEPNEILINYLPLIKFGWINIDSSVILLLRLLIKLCVKDIYIAGLDGFCGQSGENYYDNSLITDISEKDLLLLTKEIEEMLFDIKNSFEGGAAGGIKINFLTESKYSKIFDKD